MNRKSTKTTIEWYSRGKCFNLENHTESYFFTITSQGAKLRGNFLTIIKNYFNCIIIKLGLINNMLN